MSAAILKARMETLANGLEHVTTPGALAREADKIIAALAALPAPERQALAPSMENLIKALEVHIRALEQSTKPPHS